MTTYEVLEKALALIEHPSAWVRNGNMGDGENTFCALAAMNVIEYGDKYSKGRRSQAWEVLSGHAGSELGRFNDTHSHTEVCGLFRKAIRSEKQKAGISIEMPAEETTQWVP